MTRTIDITQKAAEIAADLSGFAASDLEPNATFLSLGFDSLFLTQLAAAFQREWKVKVTEPTIALRREIGNAPTMNDMAKS